jgi:hypothetical protein
VGGGIGYVKRNDPSADIKTAHPHTEYWQQVPGLVSDGILFTRVTLSTNVKALEFLAPPGGGYAAVGEEAAVGGKREQGGLLSPDADADAAGACRCSLTIRNAAWRYYATPRACDRCPLCLLLTLRCGVAGSRTVLLRPAKEAMGRHPRREGGGRGRVEKEEEEEEGQEEAEAKRGRW